jgi:hypothetical protein
MTTTAIPISEPSVPSNDAVAAPRIPIAPTTNAIFVIGLASDRESYPGETKISAAAGGTRIVVTAVPPNTDALTILPSGNARTELIDGAHYLVSWNTRVLNSRPRAFFHENVTAADATGLYLDPHVSQARLRHLSVNNLEISSRLRNLSHLHCRYCCDGSCCGARAHARFRGRLACTTETARALQSEQLGTSNKTRCRVRPSALTPGGRWAMLLTIARDRSPSPSP